MYLRSIKGVKIIYFAQIFKYIAIDRINMEKEYDVVIVGAGPAGAQCARYLCANSKLSVALLDRTQEIGEPKKSTAGTFMDTIKEFSIPAKVVMQKTDEVIVEGPSSSARYEIDGVVLEFGLFKKFLVDEAVKKGCDLNIATTVTHPIMENGKVSGVKYHSLEGEGEIKAKLVIDASGPAGILTRQLGLGCFDEKYNWVGLEFEMENIDISHDKYMLFKLDQNFAPGGYSWIFSAGKNRAKVGNCWSENRFKKMGGQGSNVSYLYKWIHEDNRLKNARAVEIHGGNAFLTGKKVSKITDGFIGIGDSVSTINPLAGEGIRPALKSGNFAAETIIEAIKKKDFSVKTLKKYESRWNKYAYTWKILDFVAKRGYSSSNSVLDKYINQAKKMDSNTIKDVLSFKFSVIDAVKLASIIFKR